MAKVVKFVICLSLLGLAFCSLMTGGWKEMDLENKEDMKKLEELKTFAVKEYEQQSNSMYRYRPMEILKARKQVVAGMKYEIKMTVGEEDCRKGENFASETECNVVWVQKCKFTIWEKPWENFKNVTRQCFNKKRVEPKPRTRRDQIPGGATEVDVTDKDVLDVADFALEELNARSNSLYRAMIHKIRRATQQVVAGIKYTLEFELGISSKCRNTQENRRTTLDQCPVDQDKQPGVCVVSVVRQAWLEPAKQYSLVSFNCKQREQTSLNNIDARFDQGKAAQGKKPILGGDDHDIGHYGQFAEFKEKYNKVYKDDEEKYRFTIFHGNMQKAKELQDSEQGTAKYGATQFADLTEEEFRRMLTPEWDLSPDPRLQQAEIPTDPAPEAFDWRDHNAVTPVKNQGMCGSCWAFSTTGNIEGQWAVRKKSLLSLSEQELVDCDKLDDGCEGGLPTNAYQEIIRLGGLETEKDYPYDARDEKCSFNVKEARVYINGSLNISTSEADMAAWLAKNGPISIGINALAMQFYMGGIAHPWKIFCNPKSLDHGVLIVGYGVEKGIFSNTPYWIIKNSWGTFWGEKGYYRLYRGEGVCGVNQMPTSALIK